MVMLVQEGAGVLVGVRVNVGVGVAVGVRVMLGVGVGGRLRVKVFWTQSVVVTQEVWLVARARIVYSPLLSVSQVAVGMMSQGPSPPKAQ